MDDRAVFEGDALLPKQNVTRTVVATLAILSTALFMYDRGSFGLPLLVFVVGFGRRRRVTKRVRVDGAGIFVDGHLAVRREAIRDAYVSDDAQPIVYVGTSEGPALDVVFDTRKEARAFATAVAEESGTVATGSVPGPRGLLALLPLAAMLAVLWTFVTGTLFALLGTALVLVMGMNHLAASRLVVGRDGFEVGNTFGRRFVAFSDVASIDDETVVLRSGKKIDLPARRFALPRDLGRAIAAELHGRALLALRERFAAYQEQRSALPVSETAPADAASAYRAPAQSPDALLGAVESGATEPEVRVRIASSLAKDSTLDVDQVRRLRVAASATADPDVRRRLEEALVTDEPAASRASTPAPPA